MKSVVSHTVRLASGLLMACVACAFVMSDEPAGKAEAPPQAKKAELKQAAVKNRDEKDKKKKAKAPAGYEDAPEAGDLPAAKEAVEVEMFFEAVEAGGFAKALDVQVDVQVVNIAKQLAPRLAPLMTAELSFIHRACNLNLEQRKKISAVSDQCLQVATRKYALVQRGMMVGGIRGRTTNPDPTELLHQTLATVLKETLQPEQQTVYDAELAKRHAFRKQVAIENVLAIIDERLVLTPDQRQILAESLEKNWQPSWVQSMEMLMQNNEYLPNIPDQFVVSALNDAQKQVWRSAQKHNFQVWNGFQWAEQLGAALDDFPLAEAATVVESTSAN